MVTKGSVTTLPAVTAPPPNMSLMLWGSCGVAPAGNALAGNALSSSSFQMMLVFAVFVI